MTSYIGFDIDDGVVASVKKIHPEAIWIRADALDTARKYKCTSAYITHDLDEDEPDEVEFVPATVYTKALDEAKLKISNLEQRIEDLEAEIYSLTEAARRHCNELLESIRKA